MSNKIDNEKLNKIIKNYPNTYEWMRNKANWEHMCLGAVLNSYSDYIENLMKEENNSK